MSRSALLSGLVVVWALSLAVAHGQTDQAALINIQIQKVKDNLYIITGGRGSGGRAATVSGNTTVFVTDSGVVLVDTKLPGFGKAILEKVRSVTPKAVTTIINTHTHDDHTGSNSDFPSNGEFIVHENTRANMAKMDAFKGDHASLLPKRTYKDSLSLLSGKDRVELHYFGAGHTNGDTVIVIPAQRAAVMGDLFARKWAPLVDAANGGSMTAFPQTLTKALAAMKDVDTLITGHATVTSGTGQTATFARSSPLMKVSDLEEYRDFTREFVAAVTVAKKAGRTAEQAAAELKLPDKYRNYDMAQARTDAQRVFDELK